MNAASQPTRRFCTPSSRSIISSARASASALTSLAGWCSRATSSLIASPSESRKPRQRTGRGFHAAALLSDLDALLREVLDGARVPGHRGGIGLLVFQLEVLRLLVHAD